MAANEAITAAPGYLATLQERAGAMVELLGRLVNMDTPSEHKELVDAAMAVVAAECRDRGAELTWDRQSDAGDHLIARWHADANAPTALILAHLDTVWPPDETERRPFTEEGDRLTGPGVFDMKAGLVQALFAVEAFRQGAAASGCNITLVVSSDEETGSRTSRPLIEREAAGADVVLVVEPASGAALKTARKGVGMYSLLVEGRAAHAGLEPENGRSAVLELAHQIIRLHDLNAPEKGTTVTVGMIEGGSGRNVVPAQATATVDLRVVTDEEAQRVDGLIRGLRPATPGTKVTVTGGINRPPMERTETTAALYARAAAIAEALDEPIAELMVGGGSDGNFTAAMGIPTLDGLGAVGGGAHALDEHVERARLAPRAALLAAVMHELTQDRTFGGPHRGR